ncbi:hypothetical protein Tco_1016888 [Tanacetum coccineum]|uniref:Uncharacterized protein n=1 Tax=Tanacetum coccineum TaxID=301880 RepID=A0ABQ5FR89_9ASTR
MLPPRKRIRGSVFASNYDDSTKESYEAYTEPDIDSDVRAKIDADTANVEASAAREADVGVEVGIGSDREDEAEEEAKSEDRGTIEIRVDRVIKPVVSDDVYDSVSDDMTESADEKGLDGLMQELYDHLVEVPVQRIMDIKSVQADQGYRMFVASEQSTIMLYFAFGRHLEEIHVTWAHLEKKQTRLRTYANIAQEFLYSGWRRRHKYNVT